MNSKEKKKSLKKLSRTDLLKLLIEQTEKNEELTFELDKAQKKLADRTINIEKSGSIAEAALKVSNIFEIAQNACDQYIENVRRLTESQQRVCFDMEKAPREKCEKMLTDAKNQAHDYWQRAADRFQEVINSNENVSENSVSEEEAEK